jgi:hypothetical protein
MEGILDLVMNLLFILFELVPDTPLLADVLDIDFLFCALTLVLDHLTPVNSFFLLGDGTLLVYECRDILFVLLFLGYFELLWFETIRGENICTGSCLIV